MVGHVLSLLILTGALTATDLKTIFAALTVRIGLETSEGKASARLHAWPPRKRYAATCLVGIVQTVIETLLEKLILHGLAPDRSPQGSTDAGSR